MDVPTDGRLHHASLSDAAFAEIRRRIISLQFEPGMRLNIDKLARELGVSPTPLREALNRLAAQKLIRVETYKGFTVEPLLDPKNLANLCSIRCLLESYALEQLPRTLDEKQLDVMRDAVDRMEALCSGPAFNGMEFNELDRRFHESIIAAADNELLLDTYKSLNVHVQIARLFQQRAAKHSLAANLEHRAMIEAIARNDTKGSVSALRKHIDNGLDRLLKLLRDRAAGIAPA
jgi:DNA-binding GntR family transcriptional regulator